MSKVDQVKYISELSEQLAKYLVAIHANIYSGIEEALTGKRRNYDLITMEKAGFNLKTVFGTVQNWKNIIARNIGFPSIPFKIRGVNLRKKTGESISIAEWEEIEKQITDYARPYLESAAEEAGVKALLLAMAYSRSEQTGKRLDDMTYNQMEKEYFNGYIPDSFQSLQDRYIDMPNSIKNAMVSAYDRVAMYITDTDDKTKSDIKSLIVDGYRDNKSPTEIASDLYWGSDEWEDGIVKKNTLNVKEKDLQRIAYTELAVIHSDGKLAGTEERSSIGLREEGKRVYYIFVGGTCEWCRAHQGIVMLQVPKSYARGGTDSLADIGIKDKYASKAIWIGKNNVGRKKAYWWTCVPAHPYNTAQLRLFDPDSQEYDKKSGDIVFKDRKKYDKIIPDEFLKIRDSLSSKVKRREELMRKDRMAGIYKKNSDYPIEKTKKRINEKVVEYGGKKYREVSPDNYADALDKWRENKNLPIPVATNQSNYRVIFG